MKIGPRAPRRDPATGLRVSAALPQRRWRTIMKTMKQEEHEREDIDETRCGRPVVCWRARLPFLGIDRPLPG